MKNATLRKLALVKTGKIQERTVFSAEEFSKQLNNLGILMISDADNVIRSAVFELFKAIVFRSPVDTGQYRANHCIAKEGETTETPKIGVTDINEALNQLLNFNWHLGDGDIWIYNNLPYAEILETGWSQQAPNGVYIPTLNEFSRMIKRELK
jgi:hypothetical protein